jgi:hypothetical protein
MEQVTGDKSKTIKETYELARHEFDLGTERKRLANRLRYMMATGLETATQDLQTRRDK